MANMFLKQDILNISDEQQYQHQPQQNNFSPDLNVEKNDDLIKNYRNEEEPVVYQPSVQPKNDKPKPNPNAMLIFSDDSDKEEQDIKPVLKPVSIPDEDISRTNNSGVGSTSQTRQQILQQQKRKLQQKLQMQNSEYVVKKNQSYKPNLGKNQAGYQREEDIDFENLNQILKDEPKQQFWEPGKSKASSTTQYAQLKKTDQKMTIKETEVDDDHGLQVPEKKDTKLDLLNQKQKNIQEEDDDDDKVNDHVEEKKNKQEKQVTVNQKLHEDSEDEENEDEGSDEQANYNKLNDAEEQKRKQMKDTNQQPQQKAAPIVSKQPAPNEKKSYISQVLTSIEITDQKTFLYTPCPQGMIMQTVIKRDQSGFGRFYPRYHCYFSHGLRHLVSGKKRSANNTSNYLMCMDPKNLDVKSPGYLGKVRSNFMGTEFRFYDQGQNPKKSKFLDQIRKELGSVLYESNLLGSRGPRKVRVMFPALKPNGEWYDWRPLSEKEDMINHYKVGQTEGMFILRNQPPQWSEQNNAFVLNFNGRVTKASVQNFQLIDQNDEDTIYLQFGRVDQDDFNMDFQWPLTPLQAFAISLTSFDYKIACE